MFRKLWRRAEAKFENNFITLQGKSDLWSLLVYPIDEITITVSLFLCTAEICVYVSSYSSSLKINHDHSSRPSY